MTYTEAIQKAKRVAKAKAEWRYVVREGSEYDTASEYDLETFFLGCEPVLAIGPDGENEE
jgi:hypothetical protein